MTLTVAGATIEILERVVPPTDDSRVWPDDRLTIIRVHNNTGVRTLKCFHNEIVIVIPEETP